MPGEWRMQGRRRTRCLGTNHHAGAHPETVGADLRVGPRGPAAAPWYWRAGRGAGPYDAWGLTTMQGRITKP
jgi:hypothetical protein